MLANKCYSGTGAVSRPWKGRQERVASGLPSSFLEHNGFSAGPQDISFLYDGETLKDRIAREGNLPVADALAVATLIAHGLGAAHRAGIVHRDLKPANVMLTADGGVKILDFGLAKVADASLTGSHFTMGTVSYMAPEQVLGRTLDGRTDLWALGVLLYEMLAGRRPFEGEHEIAIAHAIVHTEPTRPAALRPALGGRVEGLVQRLLSKEPARRYASAEDVAAEIVAVSHDLRPPLLRRISSFFDRRRRALTAAALLAVILTAIGAGVWLLSGGERRSADLVVVAVVPFQSEGEEDGEDGYLASGLADAFATHLSRLRAVAVPGDLSTLAHHGSAEPLPRIAQELEVDAVVRGSVRRTDDIVRLDIELFDGRARRQPRTRTFERPATQLLELLELMLSMPAGREVSVPLLRIAPTYDALRSDPRFEQLIERFSRS